MIINLHGLNGERRNSNYKVLNKKYAEDLVSPQIDYMNISPVDILLDILKTALNAEKVDFVVGHSLGGFYAYLIAQIIHCPCILTNPCLPPHEYVPKLEPDYVYAKQLYTLYNNLICKVNKDSGDYPIFLIQGNKDDIIDGQSCREIIKADYMYIVDGGHSFSNCEEFPEVFEEVLGRIINKSYNNLEIQNE